MTLCLNSVTEPEYTAWKPVFNKEASLPGHIEIKNFGQSFEKDNLLFNFPGKGKFIELTEYSNEIGGINSWQTSVLIPEQKYAELEQIVAENFGQRIDDVALLRANRNIVYQIKLKNGEIVVLKEFQSQNRDRFLIDSVFMSILAGEGIAPESWNSQNGHLRLFSRYLGDLTLKDIKDARQLEEYYDRAIEMLVVLEDAGKRHKNQIAGMNIPIIGKGYYERKCIQSPERIVTAHPTLIPEDFYPGHVIIDSRDNKAKMIDCESVCYGPVELALANLLVNTSHNLSPEFMQKRLEHYLSLKPEIDKKQFYDSFNVHAGLAQSRVARILDTAIRTKESAEAYHARNEFEGRERVLIH